MKKNYCEQCGRLITTKNSTHYCKKHFWQIQKYGKCLDCNPRTKFDPNEFRFIDNYVEFDTYTLAGDKVATYKIDAEDYPQVCKYHWRSDKLGYAITNSPAIMLHRLIMQSKPGQQIDHINLNVYDNRKYNLRICNNSLNSSNRRGYNNIGVKGVEYHKKQNKYSAYFGINGKQYHSPCYKTVNEAAFARFILEQSFRKEILTQFNEDYIKELSKEQKIKIISDIKRKFNL